MNYKRFLSVMAAAGVMALAPLSRADAVGYKQTNLVADKSAAATPPIHTIDPNLVNPWGVAFFPDGPFWISDNGTGKSTRYDGAGNKIALTVTIPPLGDTNPGAPGPSGMVWNGNPGAFPVPVTVPIVPGTAALFIWATEDGTIAAWRPTLSPITGALTVVPNTNLTTGPVYKGLAIGNNSTGLFLYATDFRNRKIAVWDSGFVANAALSAKFLDNTIPSTFAPFGIQNIL